MSWYSLLPGELTTVEGWIIRFFVILGTLTISPWAFFIIYDILLYVWRAATYEIPFIGGRAKGRHWPAAPSLIERPSGDRRRAFTFTGTEDSGSGDGKADTATGLGDGDQFVKRTGSDGNEKRAAGSREGGSVRGRG